MINKTNVTVLPELINKTVIDFKKLFGYTVIKKEINEIVMYLYSTQNEYLVFYCKKGLVIEYRYFKNFVNSALLKATFLSFEKQLRSVGFYYTSTDPSKNKLMVKGKRKISITIEKRSTNKLKLYGY